MINQTPCAVCGEELTDDARLLCKRCEHEAQSISTKDFYLRMISRPDTDARFLNSLRDDVNADDTLHGPEKNELFTAINNKFAVMNAAALPPSEQSPRWVGTARCAVPAACSGGTEESVAAPVRRGCKHLIAILLTLSLSHVLTLSSFAGVSDTCNGNAPELTPGHSGAGQRVAANFPMVGRFASGAATAVPAACSGGTEATGVATLDLPTSGPCTNLMVRRLFAISMIESGDNDTAIGRAGEVSRYQIRPDVWEKYFLVRPEVLGCAYWTPSYRAYMVRESAGNLFTAWHIAWAIATDRCNAFAKRFHRAPSDEEFYLLWARPSWLLMGLSSTCHHRQIVTARAQRFANLCNRNP